jgi:hypothetical protein
MFEKGKASRSDELLFSLSPFISASSRLIFCWMTFAGLSLYLSGWLIGGTVTAPPSTT